MPRSLLTDESAQGGLLGMVTSLPDLLGTAINRQAGVAGKGLRRFYDYLTIPGYGQEPNSVADDLARRAQELGSVAGSDPELQQRMRQRANDAAIAALTVYHGSPYKFDKFDMSKIGTGEGAQAYGHGLYMAEAPGVAIDYAKNLANRDPSNQLRLNAHANAKRLVNLAGDEQSVIDDLKFGLQYDNPQKELLADTLRLIESGEYKKPLANPGVLYKADIPDEAVARMLDWDKPLSEQHPDVRNAVKGIVESEFSPRMHAAGLPNSTGENLLGVMAKEFGGQDIASKYLKDAGIPGIKYADAMSRGTDAGTRNFVLFDDALARILERNGEQTGLQAWKPGEWQGQGLLSSVPMKQPDIPPAPGTAPIPEGYVRLYHQTGAENIDPILKEGLSIKHAKGIEGPRAVYASEKGFYGAPDAHPTIEFMVPKDKWSDPFVLADVPPEQIIGGHLPWHGNARYMEENQLINDALAGKYDYLLNSGNETNEAQALRYIKDKYGQK